MVSDHIEDLDAEIVRLRAGIADIAMTPFVLKVAARGHEAEVPPDFEQALDHIGSLKDRLTTLNREEDED